MHHTQINNQYNKIISTYPNINKRIAEVVSPYITMLPTALDGAIMFNNY